MKYIGFKHQRENKQNSDQTEILLKHHKLIPKGIINPCQRSGSLWFVNMKIVDIYYLRNLQTFNKKLNLELAASHVSEIYFTRYKCTSKCNLIVKRLEIQIILKSYTVKLAHEVTSIKQSPVLRAKGHLFLFHYHWIFCMNCKIIQEITCLKWPHFLYPKGDLLIQVWLYIYICIIRTKKN